MIMRNLCTRLVYIEKIKIVFMYMKERLKETWIKENTKHVEISHQFIFGQLKRIRIKMMISN